MVDLVKHCLFISYYLGRFFGVLNFEIDLKTGRSRVTKRATISAAVSHLLLIFLMWLHTNRTRFVTQGLFKANSFQEIVLNIIANVRMVCVLLSLACRWLERPTYLELFNSIYRLYTKNPDMIRYCRRSIVSKCFCAIISELLQVIVIIKLTANRLSFRLALSIWCVLCLTSTINVIITQYFAAIAILRGSYTLLNKKLRSILAEIQSLVPNRSGVFMIKCCHLADILEEIARTQSHLQKLTECLSRTYRVQIICMAITYYLNFAGIFYFMFTIKKYKLMTTNWPGIILVGAAIHLIFYCMDCWLNFFNILYLIDSHYEMVKILNQRTLFQPGLDQRLEAVLESFVLNLARNPFKLSVFGLFKIDRMAAFAVANSLLTHSILLIQCDEGHYIN